MDEIFKQLNRELEIYGTAETALISRIINEFAAKSFDSPIFPEERKEEKEEKKKKDKEQKTEETDEVDESDSDEDSEEVDSIALRVEVAELTATVANLSKYAADVYENVGAVQNRVSILQREREGDKEALEKHEKTIYSLVQAVRKLESRLDASGRTGRTFDVKLDVELMDRQVDPTPERALHMRKQPTAFVQVPAPKLWAGPIQAEKTHFVADPLPHSPVEESEVVTKTRAYWPPPPKRAVQPRGFAKKK